MNPSNLEVCVNIKPVKKIFIFSRLNLWFHRINRLIFYDRTLSQVSNPALQYISIISLSIYHRKTKFIRYICIKRTQNLASNTFNHIWLK